MTLTPEQTSQQERTTASRTIAVDLRDNKTMTRHRMGYLGSLKFKNLSQLPLVITASAGEPFMVSGCQDAMRSFTVPGTSELTVTIHQDFKASIFTYSARIGNSTPEDPIIILDRD